MCRAVGQLESTAALPALLEAAVTERQPREVVIRLGALESITVMTNKLGAEKMLAEPRVLEVLLECSRTSDANEVADNEKPPVIVPMVKIRSVAAYALGVLVESKRQLAWWKCSTMVMRPHATTPPPDWHGRAMCGR